MYGWGDDEDVRSGSGSGNDNGNDNADTDRVPAPLVDENEDFQRRARSWVRWCPALLLHGCGVLVSVYMYGHMASYDSMRY